jgi:hypothetical protein
MFKHWRTIVGILCFVKPVWDGTKWLLDWFGRFDLIASHLHDFGVQAVLDFVLKPPAWTVWPTIAVGCLLIWWDIKGREGANPDPNRKLLIGFYSGCAAVAVAVWGMALSQYFTLPAPAPKPIETPKAVPSSQLLSRLDHFIFACDVPPPNAEAAAKFPQAREEMRQRFIVWGDVVGMSITVTDIRGGFRIDGEANTEEAKRRMFVAGGGRSLQSVNLIEKD